MPEKNSNRIIKELLDAWISGDVSSDQLDMLNQAASDDPFLSDALEGLSMLSSSERKAHLNQLSAQLEDSLPKKKRKGIVWWHYSAAAVVLLFIGFWFLYPVDNPSETLATNDIKQIEAQPEALARDEKTTISEPQEFKQENEVIAESAKERTVDIPKSQPIEEKVPATPEPPAVVKSPDITIEELVAEVEKLELKDADQELELDQTPIITRQKDAEESNPVNAFASPNENKERIIIPSKKNTITPATISGLVVDLQGEAIIAAAVQITGTGKGVITDFDGNFEIEIPFYDPEKKVELLVTYIGYNDQTVFVSPGEDITIHMEPATELMDEVVVVGHGEDGESGADKTPLVNPTPLIGKKKYNTYLKSNLKYPDEAREKKIEGKVKVEFLIDGKGRPYYFEIKQGLGYGCDEEAIRLIREGPKWDFGPEFKNRRQWKVEFKLP